MDPYYVLWFPTNSLGAALWTSDRSIWPICYLIGSSLFETSHWDFHPSLSQFSTVRNPHTFPSKFPRNIPSGALPTFALTSQEPYPLLLSLRCIKDWISTVLVSTRVACNISGKETAMGIWCDIPSHPTRPRPLPHPKPRPQIFNTFVPAKHTGRVADLQEQLFSLFFLDWSIIALNRFLGRRMIVCARVSQKRRKSSPKIHTYTNNFCFSTPYYCTANPPTDHS